MLGEGSRIYDQFQFERGSGEIGSQLVDHDDGGGRHGKEGARGQDRNDSLFCGPGGIRSSEDVPPLPRFDSEGTVALQFLQRRPQSRAAHLESGA